MPEINNPGSGSGGLGAANVNLLSQGRLTLLTGDPAPAADQVGKGTIYFTPYKGDTIALFDGSAWEIMTFTEISIALAGLTSGKNYDIFAYDNAGVLTLELGPAWTNDTTRSGPGALMLQDGVRVLAADPTRRFLGTFRATAAGTTEDSKRKRFLINYYNRVARGLFTCPGYVDDGATTFWSSGAAVWAEANSGVDSKVEFLSTGEDAYPYTANTTAYNTGVGGIVFFGIGRDSGTDARDAAFASSVAAGAYVCLSLSNNWQPSEGYHFLDMLANAAAGGTNNYAADTGPLGSAADSFTTVLEASIQG